MTLLYLIILLILDLGLLANDLFSPKGTTEDGDNSNTLNWGTYTLGFILIALILILLVIVELTS